MPEKWILTFTVAVVPDEETVTRWITELEHRGVHMAALDTQKQNLYGEMSVSREAVRVLPDQGVTEIVVSYDGLAPMILAHTATSTAVLAVTGKAPSSLTINRNTAEASTRRELPELWGLVEIAEQYGPDVSVSAAMTLVNTEGFPDPSVVTRSTTLWYADEVRVWIEQRRESCQGSPDPLW